MPVLEAALLAGSVTAGLVLVALGVTRWRGRSRLKLRVLSLDREWRTEAQWADRSGVSASRWLAGRLGAQLARRFPSELGTLASRVDRAGLTGGVSTVELLGWKVLCAACGTSLGIWAIVRYGGVGDILLVAGALVGWFGVDLILGRYHATRRRRILHDLPTVMDLLVLSLEAGMSLDRALRTVTAEYHSPLSDEIRRVLHEIDLGVGRGEAFERMALRVGLEDLRSLSRAIVQSEELGVSVVTVMRTQSREVRLSRRRAAEAEALRAPVKMVVPLVVFILPTLFMLLLGPVGLRAAATLGGVP